MKKYGAFLLIMLLCIGLNAKEKKSKHDKLVTISTRLGDILIVLYDDTPEHKKNFLKLASEGFYDSTTFHRVIDNFMIQGGDPNSKDANPGNDGMGSPGYTIKAEFNDEFKHKFGAVAAARIGGPSNPEKRSSGSQFYIVENEKGTPFLDGNYTVFGETLKGLDVVQKIAEQKKDGRDRPIENIEMIVTVQKVKKKKITKTYGYSYE